MCMFVISYSGLVLPLVCDGPVETFNRHSVKSRSSVHARQSRSVDRDSTNIDRQSADAGMTFERPSANISVDARILRLSY